MRRSCLQQSHFWSNEQDSLKSCNTRQNPPKILFSDDLSSHPPLLLWQEETFRLQETWSRDTGQSSLSSKLSNALTTSATTFWHYRAKIHEKKNLSLRGRRPDDLCGRSVILIRGLILTSDPVHCHLPNQRPKCMHSNHGQVRHPSRTIHTSSLISLLSAFHSGWPLMSLFHLQISKPLLWGREWSVREGAQGYPPRVSTQQQTLSWPGLLSSCTILFRVLCDLASRA